MNREPWLERKYVIMMAKWWGAGVVINAIIIGGLKLADFIEHFSDLVEVTVGLTVSSMLILVLLAYARIYLPKLLRKSTPPPKDTFFLRGISLAFGLIVGLTVGLMVIEFLE